MSTTTGPMKNSGLLVTEPGKPLVPHELEMHVPGPGEVLIRNESVAQNPIDWKSAAFGFLLPPLPAVVGVDTAGVIEAVGEGVAKFKKGDRVMAQTQIGADSKYGVYQKYSISRAGTTTLLPAAYTFDEACTIPLGYYTAALALFCDLGLPVPSLPAEEEKRTILIWGAASCVGSYAVQLARMAGLRVVGTASEQNWEAVRARGAHEVFDYRDADVVAKVRRAAPRLDVVFDAVCQDGSSLIATQCMVKGGGSIACTLEFEHPPEGVTVFDVFGGAHFQDERKNALVTPLLHELMQAGKLVPNTVKVMPDGLGSVREGWEMMREGKGREGKGVYHPQEE